LGVKTEAGARPSRVWIVTLFLGISGSRSRLQDKNVIVLGPCGQPASLPLLNVVDKQAGY
jgi:hypothetical protein